MKKKISLLLIVGLVFGCSANEKADRKLVCEYTGENDSQTVELNAEIEFNNESGLLYDGVFSQKYENLEKNETNNNILENMINRQSILEDLDGLEVTLNVTSTSFNYQENWNYREVDIKEAQSADSLQGNFIDTDYSVFKMRDHFEMLGYTCKIENIEEE